MPRHGQWLVYMFIVVSPARVVALEESYRATQTSPAAVATAEAGAAAAAAAAAAGERSVYISGRLAYHRWNDNTPKAWRHRIARLGTPVYLRLLWFWVLRPSCRVYI